MENTFHSTGSVNAPVKIEPFTLLLEAEQAWQAGQDQLAETLLMSARYQSILKNAPEMIAQTEVAMAHYAIAIDHDQQAIVHLQTALEKICKTDLEWMARLWLALSTLRRRKTYPAITVSEPDLNKITQLPKLHPLAGLVCVELSHLARERLDFNDGKHWANQAVELTQEKTRERAMAMLALGDCHLALKNPTHARTYCLQAIDILKERGCKRDAGRAMIRYALEVLPHLLNTIDEKPATWLASAKTFLDPTATWRDLATLHTGFRDHGRRLEDRAIDANISERISLLEQTTAKLRHAISASIESADRNIALVQHHINSKPEIAQKFDDARRAVLKVLDVANQQSDEIARLGRGVIEIIGAFSVERERFHKLLNILSELHETADQGLLGEIATRLAAQLFDADCIVIVQRGAEDQLEEVGRFDSTPNEKTCIDWQNLLKKSLADSKAEQSPQGCVTRSAEIMVGPVLVTPINTANFEGALYLDRLQRKRKFFERDKYFAQLFSDYFALSYSRLLALQAKRQAYERLETTLHTIRDGVLTIDGQGVVKNLNQAAMNMLCMNALDIVGKPLFSHPTLAPLSDITLRQQEVDGAVVRLEHNSFIVTVRPLHSHKGTSSGVVVTLVEMERAKRIAQRVTISKARYTFDDIIGSSTALQNAIQVARQIAKVDANVLITGESGTGKEVLAQAIHNESTRAREPFVGVNCAAVPRDLLETELFGYERGAFTGAKHEGNIGKFELAGHGTILLDEIGDMPLEMQAKLLRVLQERIAIRIGGHTEYPIRARVVATTHRNLDDLVEKGLFRHDLLFRLRVLNVHLPPLRERGDDVLLLAKTFIQRFARLQNKQVRDIALKEQAKLSQYNWPGNIRELANIIERAVSLLDATTDILDDLHTSFMAKKNRHQPFMLEHLEEDHEILPFEEVERRYFLHALNVCKGQIPLAAKALGVSKVTFYNKLKQWGLHPKDKK